MARILQDGFETEGKVFDDTYQKTAKLIKMDVGEFIFALNSSSGASYKCGLGATRGGYGQKGFCIESRNENIYYQCAVLKYNLTNFCNDTSELFYRIWVKPKLSGYTSGGNSTRIYPFAITNTEFEKSVTSRSVESIASLCNILLTAELIDAQTYLLNCYCGGVLVYSYNFLSYNQWVKLDIRHKVGDANNGIFQLRINDKLITTYNGSTGKTNPEYLYIGFPLANGQHKAVIIADDIAINDTTGNVNNSWCGNGSIIGIAPTANGSKTMFTPGIEGTQNFENVDELEPDGDVTYNSSYALGDVDLFKFTIPENLEIPPTETINAISVTTSAKFVEQPVDIGHIVSDGVTDTLIGQYITSNDYTQQCSIIQEKSDGTKYKVSDIEGLEFGYKTLESSKAQEE